MSKKNNDILKRAFQEADKLDPPPSVPDDFDWTPSPEFEARMESLIRSRKRPIIGRMNAVGRRAAVFLLIFAVIVVMTVSAYANLGADDDSYIRLGVYNRGKFTEVRIESSDDIGYQDYPNHVLHSYIPTSIPDGYTLAETDDRSVTKHTRHYRDDYGGEIVFMQSTITEWRFDYYTEGGEVTPCDINGEVGYSFTNIRGNCCVFWLADEYYFSVSADGGVSVDDLLELAQSVTQMKENGEGER